MHWSFIISVASLATSLLCLLLVFLLLAVTVIRAETSTCYVFVYQVNISPDVLSRIPKHERVSEDSRTPLRCRILIDVTNDANITPLLQALVSIEGGGDLVPIVFAPIPAGIARNMPASMCVAVKSHEPKQETK